MPEFATLLHISDLHFNSDLTEGNKSVWVKLPILDGLAAHDFQKLSALSTWLGDRRISGERIDLTLATGDICTDGSTTALETALEFIEGKEIARFTPPQWVVNGLDVSASQRIIVPGNHDRYVRFLGFTLPFQGRSDELESVFFTKMPTYPYVLGYRRETEDNVTEKPALLFFVFDSTASQPTRFRRNLVYRAARGYVSDRALVRLRMLSEKIKREGVAPSMAMDGTTLNVDYDRCVKIAVLHHHPISTANEAPKSDLSRNERIAKAESAMKLNEPKDKLKFLENHREFLRACFNAEINLVLFGHQHVVFSRSSPKSAGTANMHFFCCPSTTQLTSEESGGFYFFKFEEQQFNVDYYRWKKGVTFYEIEPGETHNPYRYRELAVGVSFDFT